MKIELAKTEIIHFVGIGGIGMSGLALIMKGMGFKIQGSDISLNKNIERLKKNKIKVTIGHQKKNISKATILVISSAIKKNNPELLFAKKKRIPIYKRGEMLANVVSLMKNVVVAGSHGKTTTTSLISNIFIHAKIDPTVINGGVINLINNTAKLGKGDWSVLESDESDGSFLKISPTYSVVTNIDKEHLDYYKSFDVLQKSFLKFVEKTPSFGKSIICLDDFYNKILIKNLKTKNYLTYGFNKKSNFHICRVQRSTYGSKFDLKINLISNKLKYISNLRTPLLGDHNIKNCTAAVAVALNLGINVDIIKKSLKNFKGVQRRFNRIFRFNGNDFYDDYAHHPTEIKATLDTANIISKDVHVVFQPHRYSRTKLLINDFVKILSKVKNLYLVKKQASKL